MQEEIINSVLSGRDTLGILPTGGGKSLTFQVPGMVLPGVVIIVTPLISLMKDQVDNLKLRKIKAVSLNSGMNYRELKIARERLFNDKAKFLYISPERLSSESFIQEIKMLKVSLIVVDEAHCISQWGYDFRPSYLKVKRLRKLYPSIPVLALTASATKEVAEDICRQLEFNDGFRIFRASIRRDNLSYVVRTSEAKLYDIQKILTSTSGSAIVYVRSRKRTREIAEFLTSYGISASFYHAGLDPMVKEEIQTLWKNDEIRVMVATNAFGMGIDKPDVRVVIHYDMPQSLEEYYQEAGRAGRDGKQSYAVLLIAKTDKSVLRRRLTMEFPGKDVVRRIYTRLCVFCHLEIGEGYEVTKEFDLLKFCRTYNMDEAVVRPALKLLGQAGYAEFIEEYENASRLTITVDREDLYRTKLISAVHEKLLTAILRHYPGLFTDYVFINEKKLSYLTHLDLETIYEKLIELSKAKVIHFIPRRKTPLIYFPTSMEEERYVVIGKNIYEERKDILQKRIEAMIAYGYSQSDCRQKILKNYFGENDESECGHCDFCRQKKKRIQKQPERSEILNKLKSLFSSSKGSASNKDIENIFGKHYPLALEILRGMARDGEMELHEGLWRLL